jgi:hypothetical protein
MGNLQVAEETIFIVRANSPDATRRNPRRIEDMARGWESKSVEEQMANALQLAEVAPGYQFSEQDSLAGDPGNGFVSEEAKRLVEQVRTKKARQLQALQLQRENILSQRTSNPSRRAALEAALTQIEGQIETIS